MIDWLCRVYVDMRRLSRDGKVVKIYAYIPSSRSVLVMPSRIQVLDYGMQWVLDTISKLYHAMVT